MILLGGALRSGKGMISRALVQRTHAALMPLDILKMGLHRAVPSSEVDPNSPSSDVGAKMWPLLRAMAQNAVETGVHCIFEGDMLLPLHAAELRGALGHAVAACFVGYREVDPHRKLAEIRRFSGLPNDWLSEQDDEYILDQVRHGIRFSDHLASECERLDVQYFDSSADFEATVGLVVDYLAGSPGPVDE